MFDFLKDILLYHEDQPLFFSQFYFWGFFSFVLFVYMFIYKKIAVRNAFLLLVSLFFYYKSGGYFLSLLILTTVMDYNLGHIIYNAKTQRLKKLCVVASVSLNLLMLAYFKYSYLFVDTLNYLFGTNFHVVNYLALWSNTFSGGLTSFDISTIILPVGISFYTFQSLSYTIDVYRQKLTPVNNIVDFAFFVTFFPQLVAGPIVRATDFISQIYQEYRLTKEQFRFAIFLILNGLIKKMLISDYISLNFVDRVFSSPESYSGFENLMAVYGYAIQIYCDFSGYTDIAIGVAQLLGFELLLNFNSPYKSSSVTEFWRRWHMSLSFWLRDYLYISLGGNRKGKIRSYINLMLTMILGGLWHGASLRFIIWGALHGAMLAIHKVWMIISPFKKVETGNMKHFYHFISVLLTFHFVCLTWVFFRASSMESVGTMIGQIFHNFNFPLVLTMIASYKSIFGVMLLGYIIHWLPVTTKDFYKGWFVKQPSYVMYAIVVFAVFIVYQVKTSDIQPFIYFQF